MGINFGGLVYAWDSGSVIALFVVAGLLILVFSAQTFYSWGVRKGFRSFPIQFLVRLSYRYYLNKPDLVILPV